MKKTHLAYLGVCVLILLVAVACKKEKQNNTRLIPHPSANMFVPKDTTWKSFTVRQKIGQLMLMLPNRQKELELGGGTLEGFFEKYPVTGFFMGWKLFDGVADTARLAHIKQQSVVYQNASKLPLIFQEDYEAGLGFIGSTSFPNEMTVGAANSPSLSYDYGKSVALECKSVGVKWVLHPVADLNINPFCPVMNVRSMTDDPDKAITLLNQQIKGLQENGVAATIKHFPGDGVDYRDQHLTTTCNSLSMERWRQLHGKVFQALIDSGIATIMPGHITLPAYQKEKKNGFYLPATLSKELLTNLLKGEMGFKGAIVSDAMCMGGFRGWYPTNLEGEIQSFLAGVDIMLWPSYEFMDTLEARINRGEIPMERLDDAVSRAWALKERFGLLDKSREIIREMSPEEKQFGLTTSINLCESAVTLVRDRNKALPLSPTKDKKILVVGVVPKSRKGGDGGLSKLDYFTNELRKNGFQVDFKHDILYENQGWEDSSTIKYDKVIFVTIRVPHQPFGPLQFYDDEAQTVWGINAMLPKNKIIVISLGSPYHANEYFERVDTYINAYSNNYTMHDAVIKALLGKIPFKGVSPVNLEQKLFNFE